MAKNADKLISDVIARHRPVDQPDALSELGERLLLEDDLDGALACFDRVLRARDRSTRGWLGRSAVLLKRMRAGEALSCLERVLTMDPSCAPAIVKKGEILVSMGLRDDAVAWYQQAAAANAGVASIHLSLAKLLESFDRDHDALGAYERALAAAPDASEIWMAKGDLLTRLGRLDEAEKCYERAVMIDPSASEGWYRLGRMKGKTGRAKDARLAFERFLDLAPNADPRLETARRQVFDLEKKLAASASANANAPPTTEQKPSPTTEAKPPAPPAPTAPKPERVPGLDDAVALYASARHIEALRKVEPLVKQFPRSQAAWILRGKILVAVGKPEPAVTSFQRAVEIDRTSAESWTLLAQALADSTQEEEALDAADQATKLTPGNPVIHRLRGRCLVTLLRQVEAVYAFEKAIHYDASDAPTWLAHARVLRQLRRTDDARTSAKKAIELSVETNDAQTEDQARELLQRLGPG